MVAQRDCFLDNGKRSRRRRVAGVFYWDDDIRKIGSEWERYSNAISEGRPGAQQAFDAWKKFRRNMVASHGKVKLCLADQKALNTNRFLDSWKV